MSEWVTQVEAADILGVHRSLIPKMLRRGDLVARPRRRPSLLREDVIALAQTRAASAAERRTASRRRGNGVPVHPTTSTTGCPLARQRWSWVARRWQCAHDRVVIGCPHPSRTVVAGFALIFSNSNSEPSTPAPRGEARRTQIEPSASQARSVVVRRLVPCHGLASHRPFRRRRKVSRGGQTS